MEGTKVLVRGAGQQPYACFCTGESMPGRLVLYRASRNVTLPIHLVDIFEFNQCLYDDLVASFDDDDQESLAMLWTKADRFKDSGGEERR